MSSKEYRTYSSKTLNSLFSYCCPTATKTKTNTNVVTNTSRQSEGRKKKNTRQSYSKSYVVPDVGIGELTFSIKRNKKPCVSETHKNNYLWLVSTSFSGWVVALRLAYLLLGEELTNLFSQRQNTFSGNNSERCFY